MPTAKRPAPAPDRAAALLAARKRDLARIHVLRAKIGLSDDSYRDLLADLFDGRRSSGELASEQRRRLLDHLTGLQRAYAKGPGPAPAAPALLPPLSPRQGKMFSLWQQLADAGLVRERGMPALKAWVTRQTQVDRWEWLTSPQEDTVIESLKRWLKRREDGAGSAAVGAAVGMAGPSHG